MNTFGEQGYAHFAYNKKMRRMACTTCGLKTSNTPDENQNESVCQCPRPCACDPSEDIMCFYHKHFGKWKPTD